MGSSLQPILPVEQPPPPRNQAWLIFYALICSNIFALFVGWIFEFLSLRGVVDLSASRIALFGAWVSGVIILCAFAWGTSIKRKVPTAIGGSVLLAGLLFGLDQWAPKPDPNASPANLTGIEKLFQKYFRSEIQPQPTPTPNPAHDHVPPIPRLSLVRYQLEPYEIDKDFKVRVYVDNRGSDALDVLAFGRSEVIDDAPIDYEPRKALEDKLRAKLILPKKNLVWLSVPIIAPGSYSIGFDGSRLSSDDLHNLGKTASVYFMGKIQDRAGNTLLEPCFRTIPGKQELLLCTEHSGPPSKPVTKNITVQKDDVRVLSFDSAFNTTLANQTNQPLYAFNMLVQLDNPLTTVNVLLDFTIPPHGTYTKKLKTPLSEEELDTLTLLKGEDWKDFYTRIQQALGDCAALNFYSEQDTRIKQFIDFHEKSGRPLGRTTATGTLHYRLSDNDKEEKVPMIATMMQRKGCAKH